LPSRLPRRRGARRQHHRIWCLDAPCARPAAAEWQQASPSSGQRRGVIDAESRLLPIRSSSFCAVAGPTRIGAGRLDSAPIRHRELHGATRVLIAKLAYLLTVQFFRRSQDRPILRHLRPGSGDGEDRALGNSSRPRRPVWARAPSQPSLLYGDAEVAKRPTSALRHYLQLRCVPNMTRIGKASLGSDSTLVAPVTMRMAAYIGAGSCITKDLPAGALALARARPKSRRRLGAAKQARRSVDIAGGTLEWFREDPTRKKESHIGSMGTLDSIPASESDRVAIHLPGAEMSILSHAEMASHMTPPRLGRLTRELVRTSSSDPSDAVDFVQQG